MPKAWYALRRTIPPWDVDEKIDELVSFCRENSVDEVISKVDSEEFTHAIPSVQWVDDYLPVLHKIKERLAEIGVVFSINPWVTVVHCDRGRDLLKTYPDIDLMVGHDGVRCRACACPLSEGWRKATREIWRRYASVEPAVIWIEDDIRLLNHQPVVYGCFCELHMREFSDRVGRDVTREELVKALLAPGEPHPYRKEWLDLNRDLMIGVTRFFEQTVHEVSPKTSLGLMCSMPNSHAIEGRDWAAFASTLAGGRPLYARPCMLNYTEESPRGLYESEYNLRATMRCLPPGTVIQTEVENCPFYGWSKSAHFTFLQCALSFIFGADGVTLNLFDHMATPLNMSPEFGRMLASGKPYLNALADSCNGGTAQGIGLVHAQRGTYQVRVEPGSGYMALSPGGDAWRRVLEPMGFPVTYGDSGVTALSGQVVRALSDDDLKGVFSGGVILDLAALKCLRDMGKLELVGVGIKREFHKYDEPLAAEEFFNPDFGGSARTYLTLTLPDLGGDALMAELDLSPGAKVVSRMVDPDAKPVYPFVVVCENELGGRVAVYPLDIDYCAQAAFLNPHRKRQLEALISWLGKGQTPLVVSGGVYPLPFRIDRDDRCVLGAFNLSLDDWPNARFELPGEDRRPKRIELLGDDGQWRCCESAVCAEASGIIRIDLNQPVRALSIAALSIAF